MITEITIDLLDDECMPVKGDIEDAGYDLRAREAGSISPNDDPVVVDNGFKIAIPSGYVGLIRPRSGLAVKHGIDVLAGVIDAGYRGEVKTCLTRHSTMGLVGNGKISGGSFEWDKGDRIAQLVIVPFAYGAELVTALNLSPSEREEKGFGSSGVA